MDTERSLVDRVLGGGRPFRHRGGVLRLLGLPDGNGLELAIRSLGWVPDLDVPRSRPAADAELDDLVLTAGDGARSPVAPPYRAGSGTSPEPLLPAAGPAGRELPGPVDPAPGQGSAARTTPPTASGGRPASDAAGPVADAGSVPTAPARAPATPAWPSLIDADPGTPSVPAGPPAAATGDVPVPAVPVGSAPVPPPDAQPAFLPVRPPDTGPRSASGRDDSPADPGEGWTRAAPRGAGPAPAVRGSAGTPPDAPTRPPSAAGTRVEPVTIVLPPPLQEQPRSAAGTPAAPPPAAPSLAPAGVPGPAAFRDRAAIPADPVLPRGGGTAGPVIPGGRAPRLPERSAVETPRSGLPPDDDSGGRALPPWRVALPVARLRSAKGPSEAEPDPGPGAVTPPPTPPVIIVQRPLAPVRSGTPAFWERRRLGRLRIRAWR